MNADLELLVSADEEARARLQAAQADVRGAAAGSPPYVAQVPIAIVAMALPQTSRAISSADWPPIVQ